MSLYRLCILTTDSSWGGTEKMIHALILGLPREKFQISLVALMGDGSLMRKTAPFCERALNLGARFPLDLRVFFKLFRFLKQGQFHILHTFLFHANFLGRVFGRMLKVPVVISSQRSIDSWRRTRHILLDRWTAGLCDCIISNSRAGKARLESVERIGSDKIFVVHNGLDPREIPQQKDSLRMRGRFGIGSGPVIGMVGNFRGMKGHKTFIEAAQLLLRIREDLQFVIVGEGKGREKYETEVKSLGLQNHFHFLGSVSDIYEALGLMDIFVLPSEWEGLPVSILEAMAFGVPVIATNMGGVPEIVKSDQTGLLIPSKDPVAIKDAVMKLLKDPALTKVLVQNARREIFENFTQEKMVRETVQVYERLLKNKGVHA